jgi:putative tryptophan/tyrosine transport system substrate-binding protein
MLVDRTSRRAFIAGLGGAAAWPLAAHAQRRMPRIAVLLNFTKQTGEPLLAAMLEQLRQVGWVQGETARFDIRWGDGEADHIHKAAADLVALAPDIIVTSSTPPTLVFLEMTRAIPIVFGSIVDPVGSGIVESLSRPGGNVTGFTNYEYSIGPKWLELLKEIAPGVKRVGILRDPTNVAEIGMLGAIQTAGPQFGVEFRPVDTRTIAEIEHAIGIVARDGNGGLIITSGSGAGVAHRDRIIALAASLKLPAVYSDRGYVLEGGLISYGPDRADQYRHVADYVDRILKGAKPADLPVQASTRFLTVINLKTAEALGLTVPHALLARADEVIE